MKKYFRHFIDNPDTTGKKVKKLIGPITETMSKLLNRPVHTLMEVTNKVSVTVCGQLSDNGTLTIGVARCSENNSFSKAKGRDYAEYRANFFASAKVVFDFYDEELAQKVFYDMSDTIAGYFADEKGKMKLHTIPKPVQESIEAKYRKEPVKKTAWTPEMIAEAKAKANSDKEIKEFKQEIQNQT